MRDSSTGQPRPGEDTVILRPDEAEELRPAAEPADAPAAAEAAAPQAAAPHPGEDYRPEPADTERLGGELSIESDLAGDDPPYLHPEQEGLLRDVPVRRPTGASGWMSLLGWLILIAGSIGVSLLARQFGWPSWSGLVILIAAASVFGILHALLERRIGTRRGERYFLGAIRGGTGPLEAACDAPLKIRRGLGRQVALDFVADVLGRMRFADVTVRIGVPRRLDPITPLDVWFEPCPIEEHAQLDQLAPHGGEELPAAEQRVHYEGLLTRLWRGGGLGSVLFWTPFWLLGALLYWQSRQLRLGFVAVTFFYALAIWRLLRGVRAEMETMEWRQCWLVPGGLVLRRPPRSGPAGDPFLVRGDKWELRRFARTTGVLWVRQKSRHRWLVLCVDPFGTSSFETGRSAVRSILRAWLSPLPPPDMQRLSDLE